MTANGGATWGAKVQVVSGVKPTIPAANGLAGTSSNVYYSIWTDEGTATGDNWGLNVGRFSNSWPAVVAWGPKPAGKPDTLQVNGIPSTGRAVGWRWNGTSLVYSNYVADWRGAATPALWNFTGLDGTAAGQAYSVKSSGAERRPARSRLISVPTTTLEREMKNHRDMPQQAYNQSTLLALHSSSLRLSSGRAC
jgi:hypothetical protein